MKWLWVSVALTVGTFRFYGGCFDDTATMIYAATDQKLLGWLHWHEWGMNAYWKFWGPIFGHRLDLYRLAIMPFGLAAYVLLGYSVRHSRLAVLGLASLLWMPETFCPMFRSLRYDGVTLLVLALQALFIRERGPWLAGISGLLAGASPLIALQAILVFPAMALFFIAAWWNFRWRDLAVWGICAFSGGISLLHFYPWGQWSYEFTTYQNLYGLCAARPMGITMLAHPIWCLDKLLTISDFDINWNHYAAAPFFWVFFGVAVWTFSKSLYSRLALCFAASHLLFSMSYYPNLLFPLFVMAAGEAADHGPERN